MNFEPGVPEAIVQHVFLNLNVIQIKGEYQFNYQGQTSISLSTK